MAKNGLRDFVGEPTIADLYPAREDKVSLGIMLGFAWLFHILSFRNAYRRNWFAATWQILVANQLSNDITRQVEHRVEKWRVEQTERNLKKSRHNEYVGFNPFENSWEK